MKQSPLKIVLLCSLALCSCVQTEQEKPEQQVLSKLEQFSQLPTDSVYAVCDLSNDSITEFPDLSAYTIHHLDLSHNQIERFDMKSLPKDVKKIDLSYNHLNYVAKLWGRDTIPISIEELDISHNFLRGFNIQYPVEINKITANNNNIVHVRFWSRLKYLDLSYNPNLNNIVNFDVKDVDTLLHEGIANKEKMISLSLYKVIKRIEQNERRTRK